MHRRIARGPVVIAAPACGAAGTPPAVGRRLARALLALGGPGSHIGVMRLRPWASATFVGARHEVEMTLADRASVDAMRDRIADCEIPVRGHFVAEAVAQPVPGRPLALSLAILTIEEA